MVRLTLVFGAVALAAGNIQTCLAWGAAGHEIVATIAQIHLHPTVREKLCGILPKEAKCHLASIATWADQVKRRYPETGPMHYVNPKEDYPSESCSFGEHGWSNPQVNILTAIMNETRQLMDGGGDIPLRFLTHYLGDLHQPLHLTGREKGGNGARVRFDGRLANLHSVWDGIIVNKMIRELGNYTTPTKIKQIESNLPGAIFDPLVRFIVKEGVWQWWRNESLSWFECPAEGDPYPFHERRYSPWRAGLQVASDLAVEWLPRPAMNFLMISHVLPKPSLHGFDAQAKAVAKKEFRAWKSNSGDPDTFFPVCPFTWAKPVHAYNCEYCWPHGIDFSKPLVTAGGEIELDTPEYMGKIQADHLVERLLAMGGLRLAGVLNTIFLEGETVDGFVVQRGSMQGPHFGEDW